MTRNTFSLETRRTGTVIVALVIATVLISSVAPTAIAASPTYTVAQDGSGDYASIQAAVDAAQSNLNLGGSDNVTIEIEPGVYYETVDATGTSNMTFSSTTNESVKIVAVRSNGTKALDLGSSQDMSVGSFIKLYNKSTVSVGHDGNEDYLSIQDAVDTVDPGTIVEIQSADSPYNETVDVATDYLILRSDDGNTVHINATNVENATDVDALAINATGVIVGENVKSHDGLVAGGGGGGGGGGLAGIGSALEGRTGIVVGVIVIAGILYYARE